MGDTMMSARLRFDWSALTATSDTSLVPAEDQTEEKSPAVDVTDEKTGIHVSAAEGVLPEGSELKVTKVSAGTEYTKAANALADVGSSFELYEVHFEKNGQEVEPDGSVVVKYLIPAGMNADNVVLYRINDDGSKTLIKGSVENGYYVVTTKGFSYYALVEKASTDNGNKIITTLITMVTTVVIITAAMQAQPTTVRQQAVIQIRQAAQPIRQTTVTAA